MFQYLSSLYHESENNFPLLKEESNMTLDQLIVAQPKLILEALYVPDEPDTASRHVMICISGFMSEQGSLKRSWQYLVEECRQRSVPLYSVRWEAKDY